MFFTKKPPVKASRTNTKKKPNALARRISLNSKKGKFIAFIFIFAVIGGGYMVYRSFAATVACRDTVLKRGMVNECVQHMQWALRQHLGNEPAVDGNFGPGTEAAVRRFQQIYNDKGFGWKVGPVDGIAGPKVGNMMCDGNAQMMRDSMYCNRVAKMPASAPAPQPAAPKPAPLPPNSSQQYGSNDALLKIVISGYSGKVLLHPDKSISYNCQYTFEVTSTFTCAGKNIPTVSIDLLTFDAGGRKFQRWEGCSSRGDYRCTVNGFESGVRTITAIYK